MKIDDVLKKYTTKSKDAAKLIKRFEVLSAEYREKGINSTTIFTLVPTLMKDVKNLKNMRGLEKKQLVIDLVNSLIESIDEGDVDTEREIMLKQTVPSLIDGASILLTKCPKCI